MSNKQDQVEKLIMIVDKLIIPVKRKAMKQLERKTSF